MEKLWYYASNNARQGPVTETELRDRIQRGEVKPDDLIWTDGMPDWVKSKDSIFGPQSASAATPPPVEGVVQPVPTPPVQEAYAPPLASGRAAPMQELPAGLQSWMKFNGIMFILQGAFYSLGCIGIIAGVPMIIAGVAMMGATAQLDASGGVPPSLSGFFEKLKTFNVALGVCNIMTLVGYILAILFSIIFFGALVAAIGEAANHASGM